MGIDTNTKAQLVEQGWQVGMRNFGNRDTSPDRNDSNHCKLRGATNPRLKTQLPWEDNYLKKTKHP